MKLLHKNFSETVLHCSRLGLEKKTMHSTLDYSAQDGKNSKNPLWTTQTRHVGWLWRDGRILRADGKIGLHVEQKSIEMMTTIVRKLTCGGDTEMDACVGTL